MDLPVLFCWYISAFYRIKIAILGTIMRCFFSTIPRFLTCMANTQVLRSNDHHIIPSSLSYLVATWILVRLILPASTYHDGIFVSPHGGFRLHCQAILLFSILNDVERIPRQVMASSPSHNLPIIIDHQMLFCRSSGNADCKLVYICLVFILT